MEFHEKLQHLRKQHGLTQEELAQSLYVSRTAISKWESGRGYPSIDSLKTISRFFSITIDELLSSEEVLTIAQEDHKQKQKQFINLLFGLLDCSTILFFVLPLFRQTAEKRVQAVSLLFLTNIQPYLKAAYLVLLVTTILLGIAGLAVQNTAHALCAKYKNRFSLFCSVASVLLFIISQQPYAAVLAFVFLLMKVWMLFKQH